jgi:hypothetical protein
MLWSRAIIALTLALAAGSAAAAPSSSCAGKFVGTWQHNPGNIETLTRDGRAICSANAFCLQGTWDCNGNSFIYTNSSGTFTYTMQPNGTITLGSNVMTRISPSAKSAPVSSSSEEPGLIEGKRLLIVQGLIGRIDVAIDLAVTQNIYDNVQQLNRELQDTLANIRAHRALIKRYNDMVSEMNQLAKDQQWPKLQRMMPSFKAVLAEIKALKKKDE